jgi:hypothetical protein
MTMMKKVLLGLTLVVGLAAPGWAQPVVRNPGAVSIEGGVTVDTAALEALQGGSAAAGADDVANPTTGKVFTFPMMFDGSTYDRLRGDSTNGLLVNLGANNDVTVSGVATAANQTTVIGHVDGIETLLGTINTAVQLSDNAISGAGYNITQLAGAAVPMTTTQADNLALTLDGLNVAAFNYVYDGTNMDLMRGDTTNGLLVNLGSNNDVTLGAAVPAGTNNIGDVDIASIAAGDNNIGNVDVASLPPLAAGSNVIGSLVANQSVNVAQIGGVAVGASVCDDPTKVTNVAISTASSGNTQLVALNGSEVIYACSYDFMAADAVNFRFVYGTGTACATGETGITGLYPLTAQAGLVRSASGSIQWKGAAANAVCVELSAAVQVSGVFSYVRQ